MQFGFLQRHTAAWRRRTDRVHWAGVAALALLAAVLVLSAERRSQATRAAWGEPVAVVRATTRLEPAIPMPDDGLELVMVPRALVPDGALTDPALMGAPGRPVAAGAIVTDLDVALSRDPRGEHRALLVAVSHDHPLPTPGTRLDLVVGAVVDPYAPTPQANELVPAMVLEAREGAWLVEVARDQALTVAVASVSGTVVPLVVGP